MRNGLSTPSPVLEARVTVDVLVSTTNGTTEVHSMRLMDNGNGDPDLMSGMSCLHAVCCKRVNVGLITHQRGNLCYFQFLGSFFT